MPSFLPTVAEQLFKDIQKTYQEKTKIPDDLLIALRFVFGSCALQALDLVDQRSVTCVSSPSGRRAYQAPGLVGCVRTCWRSSGMDEMKSGACFTSFLTLLYCLQCSSAVVNMCGIDSSCGRRMQCQYKQNSYHCLIGLFKYLLETRHSRSSPTTL
ncbi:zinc finger SWIM domain-containing protein 7 isoform X1 [Oncorhynchus kisutch]|uniref:zinc finger SWIM domain-containing protein 7 isoform X1 n=1 Tax=Oncorhynchus kisutch TaxID=8019 RepID=UPI0012DD96A3|nr:zinc finger SWIM domain-containing protein 7 isoform X1 [Oncorhynchus kisutch]